MSKLFRRRAFTLPEVLVTVTIVAVLAAVIVPAVINQVAKGDQPAIAQDLSGIRTAITTFAADTRRFPGLLSDLGGSTLSDSTGSVDILGNAYGTDAVAGYHGPYASITSGHRSPTGALFANTLVQGGGRSICMKDSVDGTGASLVSAPQAAQIKMAVDQDTTALNVTTFSTSGTTSTGLVTYSLQNNTGTITVIPGTFRVCLTTY